MSLELVKKALERRGFTAYVCEDRQAVYAALEQVAFSGPPLPSVGFGNSQTLRELEVHAWVQQRAEKIYIHSPLEQYNPEEDRLALQAPVYMLSANGLSADGLLVNIDGTGNRVAAACFGPQHVIYVVGRNKIAPSLEGAVNRARQAAATMAGRYGRKTPCVVTGKCEDCLSPECICGVTTIHRRALIGNRISVLLVDAELGV